jgi:hypothetical protein
VTERSDAELNELAGKLFEAGRDEPVPPEARARALQALDLPQAAPAPSGAVWRTLLKWGGAGVLAVGIGAGVLATRTPPRAEVAARQRPAPTSAVETVAAPAPLPPPALEVAPAAEPAPAPSARSSATSARRAPAPASSSGDADALGAELAALDRARSALRGGDAPGALDRLAEYDRTYPRGALRSEALLLRVEALVRSGRKAEAERLAAPILKANPDGLAARRLRGLLE